MGSSTAVYILIALCGMLFGIVGTLLVIVVPLFNKVSKNEANIANLNVWVPKISASVDKVISLSTTLVAELKACHKVHE
jgi:hypothetical protein